MPLGEVKLIHAIGEWLGDVSPPSPTGMGDDCALIDTSQVDRQLLTTDSVSYGRHFDDTVTARAAGEKLIKRNLSDIAAMGGYPGPALLNLLCASEQSQFAMREIMDQRMLVLPVLMLAALPITDDRILWTLPIMSLVFF